MKQTRKLTTAALLTALTVGLMSIASLMPSGSIVLLVAASMLPAVVVLRCGLRWGMLCYVATALLLLLLFPGRLKALLFVVVLGHYGVSKAIIERLRRLPQEWICKLALFNGTLALCWWLVNMLTIQVALPLQLWLLWLLANGVFVLYDLGYTAMIAWYQRRFSGRV